MPRSHGFRSAHVARIRVVPALLAGAALLGPLATQATATRTPTGGGGSVVLEPVSPTESRRTWRRLVYTCASPGLVVFSDRPCGDVPIMHEVKGHAPVAAVGSGAAATVVPPQPSASIRPAPSAAARNEEPGENAREATCLRLQEAVRALDDRMRAGYSARQAALLWSRWREAKERLREAEC